VDGFGTGGAEVLRSGGTKSFGAEASAAQKRVLRRLRSSSRSSVSLLSGSEIVRLLVAKALEANRRVRGYVRVVTSSAENVKSVCFRVTDGSGQETTWRSTKPEEGSGDW
jgi:hypothetical protein